ncbi:MAG TPA: hypothetical protein PKJ41_13930 [Bryobacteraceae bacterium]|nr:hypothetical protein [Bryobacteraceae bacterium]
MKHIMLILGLMGCLAAAEPPKRETKQPAGLPEGAEPAGDRTWRYKDKAGKTWIYVRTPFGFSKAEEKTPGTEIEPAVNKEKVAAPAFRIVSVKGDVVAFERDSPFGKSKWTKKKSELAADELAELEKFQTAAPAAEKK